MSTGLSAAVSALVCHGCGARVPATGGLCFSCPSTNAGDDVDHVLRRELPLPPPPWPGGREDNPLVRYRSLLHPWHLARAAGLSDDAFLAIAHRLDVAIAAVDGKPLRSTPLLTADDLASRIGVAAGHLLVKVESGNVAGSHKARHLAGVMLALEVDRAARAAHGDAPLPLGTGRLAIASCGNAALAAAVVARAARRDLDVYVPTWAHQSVLGRLHRLGAHVVTCPRAAGIPGDPCYHAFRRAVRDGAVPFCCQGPDNALTVEGGSTLAWEIVDALAPRQLDRLFVQVGGGALASACALGFADALRCGRLDRLPKLHAVQARGGHPLVRAYERALAHAAAASGLPAPGDWRDWPELASRVAGQPDLVAATVRHAATHRSHFMWPWESEPVSLATGILDDETYDWLAVLEGMLATGGFPVLVDDVTIAEAHRLAHATTEVDVCHTGVAGLAGLMTLLATDRSVGAETIAVIFSGATR